MCVFSSLFAMIGQKKSSDAAGRRGAFPFLILLTLLAALFPAGTVPALAEDIACGDSLTCAVEDGTLTISGSGEITKDIWDAAGMPGKRDVSSVVIGENITAIGYNAFHGCSSLGSMTLPDSLTSIGNSAFVSCDFESVTIPDSVTSIGTHAFMNCSSLGSVTIPSSVTSIGDHAFDNCSSLTAIHVDENNADYSELSGILFNKDQTTMIKYPEGKTDIASYEIPGSVTSIGDSAFSRAKLSSVTIPAGVTRIGSDAFNSSSLTSVIIPPDVTSIGYYAFGFCDSLGSVCAPAGLISDPGDVGLSSDKLHPYYALTLPGDSSITAEPSETLAPISTEGTFYYFKGETVKLTADPGKNFVKILAYKTGNSSTTVSWDPAGSLSFTMPAYDVTASSEAVDLTVEAPVYTGEDLTASITVKAGGTPLTAGTDYTVSFNQGTETGVAPKGPGTYTAVVTGTGCYAGSAEIDFSVPIKCGGSLICAVEDGILTISGSGVIKRGIWDAAGMPGKSDVSSVVIRENITAIGARAFQGCSSLESVTIPSGVTSIGEGAFYGCSFLGSVDIPDGVAGIESFTFQGCSSLRSVIIPDSVTSIGNQAFFACSSLGSVTLPSSVISIGTLAFEGCGSLTAFHVDEKNEVYSEISGVLFDKDQTILIRYPEGKTDIPSYVIPGSVMSVGDAAFRSVKLSSVIIPPGVTDIGSGAFGLCDSLESVCAPAGLISDPESVGISSDTLRPYYVLTLPGDGSITAEQSETLAPISTEGTFYYCGDETVKLTAGPLDKFVRISAYQTGDSSTAVSLDPAGGLSFTMPGYDVTASSEAVDLTVEAPDYTGADLTASITVKAGGTPLTAGIDYTVSFNQGTETGVTPKEPGTYTAVITGTGCYAGTAEIDFSVSAEPTVLYTVTFVDDDGSTVLMEAKSYFSGTPAEDIEKPAPDQKVTELFIYTFTGWSPEVADVTENAVYTAVYDITAIPQLIETMEPAADLYADGLMKPLLKEPIRSDGGTVMYSLDGVYYSPEIPQASAAGTYVIRYYIKGDDSHADSGSPEAPLGSVTVNIAEEDTPRVVEPEPAEDLYADGQPKPLLKEAAKSDGGTVMYSLDGVNYSPEIPQASAAGTYVIRYYIKGDDSHADSGSPEAPLGSVTVTIAEEEFKLKVNFVFIRNDGSRGVPFDLREDTLHPVITIKDGEQAVSQSHPLTVTVAAGDREFSVQEAFLKKVDPAPGKYGISVSGLPERMAVDVYGRSAADSPKYSLSSRAEINAARDGEIVITVYLIFAPPYAEPVVVPLPEDEIGAYGLREDGTKVYLLFHTYDICMDWLGNDELCSGYERCFHKDGK